MDAHRPPITTTNVVTAVVAIAVVVIAVIAVALMPLGSGSISDLEYSVWTQVLCLRGRFNDDEILAPETTTGGPFQDDLEEQVDVWLAGEGADEAWGEPVREALRDYLRKNEKPWPVEDRFAADKKIRVMPVTEWPKLTTKGLSLGTFRKLFPEMRWLHRVSRVGFDRRGLFALVATSRASDGLSGGGGVILLRWDGKDWKPVGEFAGWTS